MTDEEINNSLMPVDFIADIEEFHEKFRLKYEDKPRMLPRDIGGFRERFLEEEYREYVEAGMNLAIAIKAKDDGEIIYFLEKQLDALVDLVYVALGTSHLQGFDFKTAWARVHAANMAKVRAQDASDSKRGSHYDVVKPKDWVAPSHTDLVEDHAHRQGELPL